jgi:hypothetical protein
VKTFPIFKTPERRMFKLCHHLKPKKKLWKKVAFKEKVVKVEEGEEDGDEEKKKTRRITMWKH